MRLKLHKLQEENIKAQEIKTEKYKSWEKIYKVLYHQSLPYLSKFIRIELINLH